MFDRTSLVRQLVPKSFSFDAYNEINCPNSRDKPFFSDNTIKLGKYYLKTNLINDTLLITFDSVCKMGTIYFKQKELSLSEFADSLLKSIQNNSDFITIEIEFGRTNMSNCTRCYESNRDCVKMREKDIGKVLAAVSFNQKDVKEALYMYYGISNNENSKGEKKMKKNNFFGMDFELGMSKDPNIAATLMGVAVKNPTTGNWYTFDVAKNSLKNIANFKMGNFPIFLLPTKQLQVGDLIKKEGKYYYVKAVDGNNITLIGAYDGVVQQMMPEENIILGMAIYTKVVAFDTKSLMDKGSNKSMGSNVLAAMCMMNWAKGDKSAEFSLDNINDDSFNGLGSCLPMLLAMKGGDIGGIFGNADGGINLPMLMMCGAGDSDQNGITQMLVLSQLLGGNSPIGDIAKNIMPDNVNDAANDNKEQVVCENCNAYYEGNVKYCPQCGSKTKSLIPNCKKCGTKLYPGALFCHECGESVNKNKKCPKCGMEVDSDMNFCPKCGHSFKEVTDASPADGKKPAGRTKKKAE